MADEWEVFHSVSWIAGSRDGEIDFVLVHPDEPLVCLEVKGGGIECRHGQWLRRVGRETEPMRDPFRQALEHRYDLERKLAAAGLPGAHDLPIVHAVALADVSVHALALAPDAPRPILLDRQDVRALSAALARVLSYHGREGGPGSAGVDRIRKLLAPTVELRVPMAEELLEEEEALVHLTHEQSLALGRMARNPRLAVHGCAGSGKTMLAVEHAKRLARDGDDVLFVCFNRALADHLARTERGSGVSFSTFHGLCAQLARRAEVPLPNFRKDKTPPPKFFAEQLPEALLEAVEKLGPLYDAVLVDEAQDLEPAWFAALELLLRDEQKGRVWLFLDDNQRVYDSSWPAGPRPPGRKRW